MKRSIVLAIALSTAACVGHRPSFTLTNDRGVRTGTALGETSKHPLPEHLNIRATELQRSDTSSVSLIEVRDREQPHVHTRYDLTVVVASGEGTLWLNGAPIAMREGDAAFIPKGTPHYFVNEGSEPAAAVVVFSPPFTGPDQQPAP
jgi:quercetin dioxygenase-like cupin family protein